MAPTATTDENRTDPMNTSQAHATESETAAAAVAQLATSSHNRIHLVSERVLDRK